MPRIRRRTLAARALLVSCALPATPSFAQQAIQLDTVVVDGGTGGPAAGTGVGGGLTTDGYVGTAATVGTKTDTELRKVPQSISVVSRQALEDRGVQTLKEALNYTSGVRVGAFGFDPRFDAFYIRGFDVTYNGVYRDGLRELTGNFSIFKTEPYGLDGLSVLKGPSSAVYGSGSPGGLVDLLSKRPTDTPFREVQMQVGSYNRLQAAFDASGPLAGNENVLYRITGLARNADTDLASAPDDRAFIAPALTLRSEDRDTQLTILGEYSDFKTGGNASYVNENGQITGIESGDPAYGDFDQRQGRIGYAFEHRFNDSFTFRQNLRYAHIDADVKYTQIDALLRDEGLATRSAWRIVDKLDSFAVDNQGEARFETGPVEHLVLGGVEYNHVKVNDRIGFGPAPSLDLASLNYGQQLIEGPSDYYADATTRQSQTGIYLQDQAQWNRVVLTAGGRYDWVDTDVTDFISSDASSKDDDSAFSGRVGLTYLFDNGISPYVSYSTSFAPTVGRSLDGTAFKPTRGKQEEIGVKYAPTDLNLTLNAALFRIRQTNVLASDPVNPGFQIQRGEVESRGFEIEATTSLADGLNLTASYTYLDLTLLAGDNEGNTPSGIPAHQVALWADYTVGDGPLVGLGVGGGVRVIGKSYGDDTNSFENGSRAFVDAKLSYDFGGRFPQLEGAFAQINATNLLDEQDPTCASAYCYLDEGRKVIGTLRYRF
ncbi:TonB-dependent siderophore receptor [Aureimonas frigidaquae]|uniref:TonB-dependent siderophore receptor n=1 Tax=Aureimonas frigidaquae TaxID=424757 RepID=UPI000782B1BC|nr:TonB-dependent siderophore receptor [Aureimonas frigidaquae]